jgi:hypothetical protein
MELRTDILLDADFDIIDEGEEWAEGESDEQHVALLILTNKGEIREFAHVGFGAERRLRQRTDAQEFLRGVDVELDNDGYTNAKIITGKTVGDFKVELSQ